jgi:hypothetical protein
VTIAEAWDILDAAGAIGRAYGFECYPTVGRGYLELDFARGGSRGMASVEIFAVVLAEADLTACADTAAVRELVERRVVEAFRLHGHARRASA